MLKTSYKDYMIKVFRKNQIVIFAIALVMITVGYLNYSVGKVEIAETSGILDENKVATIGDAVLVSSENVNSPMTAEPINTNENLDNNKCDENIDNSNDISMTSQSIIKKDSSKYFKESKLERENMYSEMLESYQMILANQNILEDQKISAQNEISKISSQKNAIMIAENLIKNKGFEEVVIFVNNESISVVIGAENLNEAEIAQVQSIIERELNVNVSNIHISTK